MNTSVTLSSQNRTNLRLMRERCRDLAGKHRVPIRELISERFLVSVGCTQGPAFFDRLSKIDEDDLAALDDLASKFTSLSTFRELTNAATADWVIGKLKERGIRSHRNHVSVKATAPAQPPRKEFALPAGLVAITDDEFRAFFGDRRRISPTDLTKLIRDGRAYEETLKPTGGHVVVIYVRTEEGDVHTVLVEGENYFERLRYFLPPRQAAQVYFFTLDVDPNNVEKAKATLAGPDKYRTTLRLTDAILRVKEDPTRIIDLIREFVDANIPGEGKELAHSILDFIALIPPEHTAIILEFLQLMLDIVGLFPGLGEPLDALNAAISLGREEYLSAGLSAASLVPVVGAIPGAGKALRRINAIIKFADALPAGIRDVLLDLLTGLKDELASLASRKISDIVSGLKRRINEAADRLRLAAKKKDDAPLPGGSGKKKANTSSSQGDAVSDTRPSKPPPKPDPEGVKPSKKSKEEPLTAKPSEVNDPDTIGAGDTSREQKKSRDVQLTEQLRESVQGKFLNPHTNKVEITKERLEGDHIVPRAALKKEPWYPRLTKEQKIEVLNDPKNITGLPKSLNASKGKKLDWTTHLGTRLHEVFIVELQEEQQKLLAYFRDKAKKMLGE